MCMRLGKHHYKRNFVAFLLIIAFVFTTVMPIGTVNEAQAAENETESLEKTGTETDTLERDAQTEVQENEQKKETNEEISTDESREQEISETNQAVNEQEENRGLEDAEVDTAGIQTYASNDKVMFDYNFDSSVLPTTDGTGANEWQIIRGSYKGRATTNVDVSNGFDAKANVSYSNDDAVRMTKNVISTGTENEFQMYLNVEPQVSWEEVLQLNTIVVSHNNRKISPPEWPAGGGLSTTFTPVPTSTHKTPIEFIYYANDSGKEIVLADVIMYAKSNDVKNGGIGIGNPLLAPEGESYYAHNNFDLVDTPKVKIDISTLYKKYEFSTTKVQVQKVQDQVSDLMDVYEDSINYDGGNCTLNGKVLNWTLPDKDLGVLPYTQGSDGKIVPVGIKRTLPNGKVTYYRQEAYQMSYKFSLNVQDESFVSATTKDSVNDIAAEYAIQTNKSPDTVLDKEKGGKVTYKTNEVSGSGNFKSPYIKGLLYDLEFQKVLEDSKVPLSGITFTLTREAGGSTHSEQITYSGKELTDEDGWIKFHDLPWGTYTLEETSYNEDDPFQNTYLKDISLPKVIGSVKIGEVLNPNELTADHTSRHSVDQAKDVKNRLYLFQKGTVENEPNCATITIKKCVKSYDTLPNNLKYQKYTIKMATSGESDVYLKPDSKATTLTELKEQATIAHEESVSYELIVPESGGKVDLEEIIPSEIKNNVTFDSVTITANEGSTALGEKKDRKQGCELTVLPGNNITVTVYNSSVGKVRIQKVIDNYNSLLKDDAFIIRTVSSEDNGKTVNVENVLKNQEISPVIAIKQTTTLEVTEILPKEYSTSDITLSGGGSLNGNYVTVNPGEDVIITVHNKYTVKPFFHVSSALKNIFK